MAYHKTKLLPSPFNGSPRRIDVLMVPIIQALWDNGIETIFCCQGRGKGKGLLARAYVQGPHAKDATAAFEVLSTLGLEDLSAVVLPESSLALRPWIQWEYDFKKLEG